MSLRRSLVGLLSLSSCIAVFNLGGCGPGNTSSSDGPASTLVISPQSAVVAVNGTQTFTAATTYATGVSWTLNGTNSGTLSTASGYSTVYTAPATPPVYINGTTQQGTVVLEGETTGTNACGESYESVNILVTAPSVTAGISPTTASVALGTTATFTAWAVGNTNGGLTVQVNGVAGGSTSAGTIALYPTYNNYGAYQYTAPTTMPMTGSTVTLTVISAADPTKTATSVITLH
jgi:hypothetical protein